MQEMNEQRIAMAAQTAADAFGRLVDLLERLEKVFMQKMKENDDAHGRTKGK